MQVPCLKSPMARALLRRFLFARMQTALVVLANQRMYYMIYMVILYDYFKIFNINYCLLPSILFIVSSIQAFV